VGAIAWFSWPIALEAAAFLLRFAKVKNSGFQCQVVYQMCSNYLFPLLEKIVAQQSAEMSLLGQTVVQQRPVITLLHE
jgi:hypothetical protein